MYEIARRPALWASLLLSALVAGAIFGSGGVVDLNRLRSERDHLAEALFVRIRENARLVRRIEALRTSDRELERLARQELGLVRENEIVYRFDDGRADGSSPLARSATRGATDS